MAATTAVAAAPMDPSQSPASPRRRGRPSKNPSAAAPNSPVSPLEVVEAAPSAYELEREARIRENMARMQKLGILDLAHTLDQSASAYAAARRQRRKLVEPGSAAAPRAKPSPSRWSLRLKNVEPVDYCELRATKGKDSEDVKSEFIHEGSKEEVYSEDHDKLLGTCQTAWTLFVDGYDKDGKRIYDQVRGKTCHQCRQKTLGHRTSCSKCQIVQGQFCGDCLYMRYGENVLEAKKNPNWICPVCRGICNCSVCRTKRGWFPTGTAYRKVVRLGYKSVAHYLIATKRSSASPDDSSNKLPSANPETSRISDHATPAAKESLEDGVTNSKAKSEGNKATYPQVKNFDECKDDSISNSAVTSDSHDDQANQDARCATPSKLAAVPKKRKVIERNPDCVASRLRSRTKKP